MKVRDALQEWLEAYRSALSKSTYQTTRGLVEIHLVPHFGARTVASLREPDALRFIQATLDKGVSIHVAERALGVLSRVLNLLVQDGRIKRNPIPGVSKLAARIRKQRAASTETVNAWTLGEVETILALAERYEPELAPVLIFLSHTGARRGEALGLRWEDVDFERGRVWIRRAVVRGEIKAPKSGKARSVPMDAAGPRLRRMLENRAATRLGREGLASAPELVFSERGGRIIPERNLNRSWERLRRRAAAERVRPLRLHDFRHTFASQAIASGVSILSVAAWLGHSATRVTEIYAHVVSDHEPSGFMAQTASSSQGKRRSQVGSDAA